MAEKAKKHIVVLGAGMCYELHSLSNWFDALSPRCNRANHSYKNTSAKQIYRHNHRRIVSNRSYRSRFSEQQIHQSLGGESDLHRSLGSCETNSDGVICRVRTTSLMQLQTTFDNRVRVLETDQYKHLTYRIDG
jgi:hypothetical protein